MNNPMSSSLTRLETIINTPIPPDQSNHAETHVAGRQLIGEPYPYFSPVLSEIFSFFDLIAVALASLAWFYEKARWFPHAHPESAIIGDMIAALAFVLLPRKRNLMNYPRIRRISSQIRYLLPALCIASTLQFIALRTLHAPNDRAGEMALTWLVMSISALTVIRGVETAILYTQAAERHLTRQIAIIGTGETAQQLTDRISEDAGHTYQILGQFDDLEHSKHNPNITGSISDLIELSKRHAIHAVIIALPPAQPHEDRRVKHLIWRLRSVLSDVYIAPHLLHGLDTTLPVECLGPHSLLVLQRRPLSDLQMIQKAAFDLVFGLIVLMFLWPLLLLVAALIKFDSKGPVFFKQPRVGFNNRSFTVFKFRTMHTNMTDLGAARQTSRDDPRVTRIGKWLRKLSIDELPQIFNVLSGDMSLVGPRPHAPQTRAGGLLLHDALAEYVMRHHVKPGITGWAQINGSRGEMITVEDLERRVALDLEYIQKWSVRFDLKIMALTIVREVFSRHAF